MQETVDPLRAGALVALMGFASGDPRTFDPASIQAIEDAVARTPPSARYRVVLLQFIGELHAASANATAALDALERAADHGLYDLAWLERCPLFAVLRTEARYERVRERIVARVAPVLAALDAPIS